MHKVCTTGYALSWFTLGNWVHAQRTAYKKFQAGKPSKIMAERVKALTAAGFEFDLQEVKYAARFAELKAFKQLKGHCNVPAEYEENKDLGRWVHTQRTQYRMLQEGKPSKMSAELEKALNAVGFQWRRGFSLG